MSASDLHACPCPVCRQAAPHPDQARHRPMDLSLSRLNEAQRRWSVALEAARLGRGGDRLLAQIPGLDEQTIRRGRAELAAELAETPAGRVRRPGGGQPPVEKKIRPS